MLFESPHLCLNAEYGIATLTLSVAGRDRNELSREVLADFDDALRIVQARPELDVLVLRSGKESGFGIGADLAEFADLRDPTQVAALARLGQRVVRRLAALSAITIAFIDGPCLDGLLELALACDWRVAVGGPATRFGFRQLRSGAIPCWGGTVLLPQVIGLKAALNLLLSGRKLSAAQALACGLIDRAVGPRLATVHLDTLVPQLQQFGTNRRARPRLLDRLPGRWQYLVRRAARHLEQTVSADHRAPREALRAVVAGWRGGSAEGRAAERAAMGRLAPSLVVTETALPIALDHSPRPTRTLSNLRLNYHDPATALATHAGNAGAAVAPTIRRVGIIGGGTAGAALAQWASLHGHCVVIQERDVTTAATARDRLTDQFRQAVEKRLIPADDVADRLSEIACGSTWDGFKDVDLVIEAVDEDIALKHRVLQRVERRIPPGAIIATATTAFTVRELQGKLDHPGRLVGLHLGHPAAALKLAELTAGPATDPAAVTRLRRWLRDNGKIAGLVADRPGRVLGRVLLPYLHEAILLAEDGVPVSAADAALRRFGLSWGPFEALDAVGLDVLLASLRVLAQTYGPDLTPPPLLERLVAEGWRGRKSGAGFYRYGGSVPAVNLAALPRLATGGHPREAVWRCVGRLVNAAFAGFGEGLVHDPAALDGLLVGAGWPGFRGGPMHYATTRGLPKVLRELTTLARRYGPRFAPCPELRRRAGRPAGRRAVA
jgi:3-hydroxyacyl-CoA dehydrogenase/enoyl-CoA hydratase/3-hydroxybutyryl-CoA epimerase